MEFLGDFLKTFLEESVDLIIYRDYIVNRRFFIYCSLACSRFSLFSFSLFWLGNHLDRSILTIYCRNCPKIALLSPFLLYSGANEVGRASVFLSQPQISSRRHILISCLLSYLFKLDSCDPRRTRVILADCVHCKKIIF